MIQVTNSNIVDSLWLWSNWNTQEIQLLTDFLDSSEFEVANAADTVYQEEQMIDSFGLAVVDVEFIHATFDDARPAGGALQVRIVLWTLRVTRIPKEPCVFWL